MDERVLSIQSHVASGYVGGKAAVFPLQLLGYDVDVVNTVNYSNHSGYGRIGGWKSTPEELSSVFEGMEKNGLLKPSRLLTGYVPGIEALALISEIVRRLRRQDPDLIYLLDPVMGDAGRLYVSEAVVPVYRELLCQSTIITPNYFEVEVLTQIQIDSTSSLQKIFRLLHKQYKVPHVVISSVPLNDSFAATLPEWLRTGNSTSVVASENSKGGEPLLCITSSAQGEDSETPSVVHALYIPRIPGYFSGVGDLFSSLVLAHFHPSSTVNNSTQTPLSVAVAKSCQTTHALLWRTHCYSMSLPEEDRTVSDAELDNRDIERKVKRMKGRELRLVKEQGLILGKGLDADGGGLQEMREWSEFWAC